MGGAGLECTTCCEERETPPIMASSGPQCPNCSRSLRVLPHLEFRTFVCVRCGRRFHQQQERLRKGGRLGHTPIDVTPPLLNASSIVCINVKKTRRSFFRRSQQQQQQQSTCQLPSLHVSRTTGLPDARYRTSTKREPVVLQKSNLVSAAVTIKSGDPVASSSHTHHTLLLPPLPHPTSHATATMRQVVSDQPDRGHLCLPDINQPQRQGRIRQLRCLFSPSNRKVVCSPCPDLSPSSPGSGKYLEVPSADGWSSYDDSGSEHSAPSSAEYSRRPRLTTLSDFIQIHDEDKKHSNFKHTQELLYNTFSCWRNMVLSFKIQQSSNEYSTGIDMEFVHHVFDTIVILPTDVQKQVLKAVISGQLKEAKRSSHHSFDRDHLRCHLILLQYPQFHNTRTYTVFAQLLRQLASLSEEDNGCLVTWLRSLKPERFKDLVHKLVQFISVRLFPSDMSALPAISKCTWWIPSATKVVGLLERANWLDHPPIVPHTEFYNTALDHTDLMSEFYSWQSPQGHATMRFSFCQYPFILSMAAKRMILQGDSEHQMLIVAKHTLFDKREWPHSLDTHDMFLNVVIRRSHLMEDSINELMQKHGELKKKVRVTFQGEAGVDLGGLTKEWFLLLTRKLFHPDYGLFVYQEDSGLYWFSTTTASGDDCSAYHLVGLLMGLAVYNSIILDIHFPLCCYKKLLSKTKITQRGGGRRRRRHEWRDRPMGYTELGLHDLTQLKPTVGKSLQEMLSYTGNVDEDFQCSFEISYEFFDKIVTEELVPSGHHMRVNNANRNNFVSMYVDHVLNTSITEQFSAFYEGFHSVCNSAALKLFRPEEVETLVCGCTELNMEHLEQITEYEGYSKDDDIIRWFWDIVRGLSTAQQKRLVHFVTGSDRVPVEGTTNLTFIISKPSISTHHRNTLPMAQTCFNLLLLPEYTSRDILREMLVVAIDNAEGFGME